MLDPSVRESWLAAARRGHPPSPETVARYQYDLEFSWHHTEGFLPLVDRINPRAETKTLACRESTRGGGKTTVVSFMRLYQAEWRAPFLVRDGLEIRPQNRDVLIFGRDEPHLRSEVMSPLKDLIIHHAPWLRSDNWQELVEDTDNPSEEGVRELRDMKSRGGQKWEAMRLDLANGISIKGRTIRQSARGFHVFYADMDDPLTEQNAHRSAEIMDLITGSIYPAIEPGGMFLLDGTPQHLGDLFDMAKQNPRWDYAAYPAYDEDGSLGYRAKNLSFLGPQAKRLEEDYLHCLWPARLSPGVLKDAQGSTREDTIKYLREYLLKRVTHDTALVHPDDILAAKDMSLSYQARILPGQITSGGADPSGRLRDDAAFVIGLVTRDGVRIPIAMKRLEAFSAAERHSKLPGEGEMSVIHELNDLSKIYRCLDWIVEGNGYQSVIAAFLRILNPSVRMEKFDLGSNKHTENGWKGLRTVFRAHQVKLPYATPEDKALTDAFVFQLNGLQFINGEVVEDPTRKNDLVSAFFLWLKSTEKAAADHCFSAVPLAAPALGFANSPLQSRSARADAEHRYLAQRDGQFERLGIGGILGRISRASSLKRRL